MAYDPSELSVIDVTHRSQVGEESLLVLVLVTNRYRIESTLSVCVHILCDVILLGLTLLAIFEGKFSIDGWKFVI